MKNVKKAVIGMSLVFMSSLGMVSVANAQTQVQDTQSYTQSHDKTDASSSVPDAYYKYGFGEVKADGQWVNDN